MSTPLSFNATEIAIVLHLFEILREGEKSSYLYKIHKELEKSVSTILGNLNKLEDKGLIEPVKVPIPEGKRGPYRYYTLTPFGQALAKVILKHSEMVR